MNNGTNNCFVKQKDKIKQQKQKNIQIVTNNNFCNNNDIKQNLSEYETEQSIPKNNTSNKQIIMASIIGGKMRKTLSPNKNVFTNDSTRKYYPGKKNNLAKSINNNNNSNLNKATGNINEKQRHDYEMIISKKDKTIKELNNQLAYFKKQKNLYNSFKSSLNNKKKSKSCSINKQKVNYNNVNNGQCTPNILYQNKNINKYYLVKNESSYGKLEDLNFEKNKSDNCKILEKHLSSFRTENNSCNNFKFNSKNKNSKINNYQSLNSQDINKKNNLLSNVVYQKKKGSKFLENKTNIINIEHLSDSSENYLQNKSNNINSNNNNKIINSTDREKIRCMGQEFEELNKKAIGLIMQFFEYYENKEKLLKKKDKGV